MTAGREQDARETAERLPEVRQLRVEHADIEGTHSRGNCTEYGDGFRAGTAIGAAALDAVLALLPSPPATTGATWAERNELAQAFHEGHEAGVETGMALAADRANAAPGAATTGAGEHVSKWTMSPELAAVVAPYFAPDTAAFADRLCEQMRRRGLVQQSLADRLGVTQTAVSYWCNGKRTPDIDTIARLADALGCDPGWLAFGTEN